jgi:hypothetical protein
VFMPNVLDAPQPKTELRAVVDAISFSIINYSSSFRHRAFSFGRFSFGV